MAWKPNIGPVFGGGGGGNAANIGNQAIGAYGNQRTVAPSAGGGIIKTPAEAQRTASAGSKAKPQRDINQPPQNPSYGYTPGGFDDPTIDWQAIYDIFVAPQGGGGNAGFSGGGSGSLSGGGQPQAIMEAPQAIIEAPQAYTAQAAPQPVGIASSASSVADAPTGQSFQTFSSAPGTFGEFQRLRNKRGPTGGASQTPEMLRRAAASRLG